MENLKSQIKFIQEIEAKEVIENAEEKAKEIIEEAEQNAEKAKKARMKEISEQLREKETSKMAAAKLEGKKRISNLKFQILEEAMKESEQELKANVTGGKTVYRESLERLIVEGAAKLKGAEFEVLVNSGDRKVVKERLKDLEKKVLKMKGSSVRLQPGDEELDSIGGAIVRTADKRHIFNNTLEARLFKVKREMFAEILASLFEEVKK